MKSLMGDVVELWLRHSNWDEILESVSPGTFLSTSFALHCHLQLIFKLESDISLEKKRIS
jgi:hypothetical protein